MAACFLDNENYKQKTRERLVEGLSKFVTKMGRKEKLLSVLK